MIHDEVFRFMNLRPVRKAVQKKIDKYFACYDLKKKPSFQESVEKLTGSDAHKKSLELAALQLTVPRPPDVLANLEEAVKKASATENVVKARTVVKNETSMEVAALLSDSAVKMLRDWYWNMLYAHSLTPEISPEKRDEIMTGIKAFHFLSVLDQQTPGDHPLSWSDLGKVRPLIPKTLYRDPPQLTESIGDSALQALKDRWSGVKKQIEAITAATEEIRNADRLYRSKQPAVVKEKESSVAASVTKEGLSARSGVKAAGKGKAVVAGKETGQKLGMKTMIREQTRSWMFSDYSNKNLGAGTRNLMDTVKKGTEEVNVGRVIGDLEGKRYNLALDFAVGLPKAMMGKVDSLEGFRDMVASLAIPDIKFKVPFPQVAVDKTSPLGRGIKPLGIGDLLVVKQKLVKYEAGEVAHIENILKSEFKTRVHTRINEIETVTEKEEEAETSSEKDTQSTERFELSTESQKAIEERTNVDAGVSLTAGYGPVSLSTHADFALSMSESETNRTASSYAKDVTERAVSRITQRVREEKRTRTLERIEEKNEHGFDNKAGSGHVIGIYRWVDKYYKARLINYGKRLMLEFIVPEPAAFYIQNQMEQEKAGVDLRKPEEPTINGQPLSPKKLSKSNYMDFVAKYNVQDAEPYPEESVSVSMSAGEAAASGANVDFAKTYDTWAVPEGYEVDDVYGSAVTQGYSGYYADYRFGGVGFGGSLKGLEGIISVSVNGWLSAFQLNMVAVCRLTEKAVAKWQLKVYQSIINAYKTQLAAYNEKVAASMIQAGVKIEGRNPDLNRKIEGDELRKGVLRILTNNFAKIRLAGNWRYNEEFNSMKDGGSYGYPEFNIEEAIIDGRIIQFFEQAIEWNNMTYFFYPYFWARKSKWDDIFPKTDHDPLFTLFLRSGAARVVVPVQPGYTEVMLHYMATNEIWNGGYPPTIHDDLYISIVDEMKAENGLTPDDELIACSAESGYPCVVDEWEVKLPTDLVYLQVDSGLPDFTQG